MVSLQISFNFVNHVNMMIFCLIGNWFYPIRGKKSTEFSARLANPSLDTQMSREVSVVFRQSGTLPREHRVRCSKVKGRRSRSRVLLTLAPKQSRSPLTLGKPLESELRSCSKRNNDLQVTLNVHVIDLTLTEPVLICHCHPCTKRDPFPYHAIFMHYLYLCI